MPSFRSFPVLVLLYIELSCKSGNPNAKKKKAGGSQEESLNGGEYSFLFTQATWNTYNEKSEYSCAVGKTEPVLMVHLSNGTQLTAWNDFCSVVVYI